MTLPIAANTDPALRARLTTILAALPGDVAEVIARVAEDTARSYRAVVMVAFPAAYDRRDDVADAQGALGRPLMPAEESALVACIRAHLEAGAAPFDPDICGACRNGDHARSAALRYPDLPAATCACKHGPQRSAEPPVHPSPAEMARRVRIEDPAAYGHLVTIGAYLEGVGAERARLRAFLIEMAEERREQAVALNDPAPRGVSEEMEAAELRGEARALRELAEGLR